MRLRGKSLDAVTYQDLLALIENKVPESRMLEYKEALVLDGDRARLDFLADVSAFANTDGGVILYGMRAERDATGKTTGMAAEVIGLPGIQPDQELLHLGGLLQDGLSPPVRSQVRMRFIPIPGSGNTVLVLGVGRSLVGPHVIQFQKNWRFHRRNDAGNYTPDVGELRQMFLARETWIETAERFRRHRVQQVLSGQVYPRLSSTKATLFVHVLPLSPGPALIDVKAAYDELVKGPRPPMTTYLEARFNADGLLLFDTEGEYVIRSYTQWFRNGALEAYTSDITRSHSFGSGTPTTILEAAGATQGLPSLVLEATTTMRETLGLEPPFGVFLTLMGARGSRILSTFAVPARTQVETDEIYVPPVILDDMDAPIAEALMPATEVIWQAGGLSGSPN